MLFCHQQAFARQSQLLANLRARVNGFMAIEVPATQVSVSDAVSTYLFNSQLLSRDDGSMMLVLPQGVGNTPEYGVISMNSLPLTTRLAN